ncbi:MAG: YfhO family protein [Anaerolineales bacterium]|nr:YfhO family protein [Anaerolineales bacterium]
MNNTLLTVGTKKKIFSKIRAAFPIGSLIALAALFFWKLVFTNLILARGDTLLYIYPNWAAAAQALRDGRFPLWNPNLFMGAPFFANSQVGFLYPLNWPFWLLFDVPTAASLSIVLHVALAAILCFGFCRQGLGMKKMAAWLAAILFGLGGYLTAQVEHVNQLQGLAWMPAVFWILSGSLSSASRFRQTILLSVVFALQLLAGHTQAVFISLVGAAIFTAWPIVRSIFSQSSRSNIRPAWQKSALPLYQLIAGGAGALALAAVQIIPTIELAQQSMRSGGLPFNEAVSFSLHPLLVGRALLPAYGEMLFSEYIAYLPLSALLLAIIGVYAGLRDKHIAGILWVGAAGLFFALGAANPVYHLLVKYIPGFALFRVPARWLALYAFAGSVLAGAGMNALLTRKMLPRRLLSYVWLAIVCVLAGWSFLAPRLTGITPGAPESPAVEPSTLTWLGWILEYSLAGLFFLDRDKVFKHLVPYLLLFFTLTSLFLASRILPYNHPTTLDAYQALRPAGAFLKAAAEYGESEVPGRFLSVSDILFDPGDSAELDSIYGDQLEPDAYYDLIIATKHKEVSSPNLSMVLDIPSVDGYDGGVLPLANYATAERLLLPAEAVSSDGRLRENLESLPEGRWLNLFNVRYLITDKVGDAWESGVYFDLQHQALLTADQPDVKVTYIPDFEATGLQIVAGSPDYPPAGAVLVNVEIAFKDGRRENLPLVVSKKSAFVREAKDRTLLFVFQLLFSQPGSPAEIEISRQPDSSTPLLINGLSLVDSRDGTFTSLTLSGSGRYRLVHSGDVKIYENLQALPRAFLAGKATPVTNDEDALIEMLAPAFDPSLHVILSGEESMGKASTEPLEGQVSITSYRPEQVEMEIQAGGDGWLVLADAHYPGWKAWIDGQLTPITRADLLFRAVPISAGSHRVVMSYQPTSVRLGGNISVAGWLTCLMLFGISFLRSTWRLNPDSQRAGLY